MKLTQAQETLRVALVDATNEFRKNHENSRFGRPPAKGYLMGTIVVPGTPGNPECRYEVRYIPGVGLSCPEYKTSATLGAKWVAAALPAATRWEPAALPIKVTKPKPVFVVVNAKGEYHNPRSGRYDIVFDPFLHLFRDAESAYRKRDYHEGCPGEIGLTVREMAFVATPSAKPAPRPTPKTKKDVTP